MRIRFSSMFLSLLCCVIILSFLSPSASAESSQSDEVLVEPLVNAVTSNEFELNRHLLQMGFEVAELLKMPLEMKRDIASVGGVKKEISLANIQVMPNENVELSNGIQDRTYVENQSYDDTLFYMSGYAVKTASYEAENEYEIYLNYT